MDDKQHRAASDQHVSDEETLGELAPEKHMPRRIPGESEGDWLARKDALPKQPDEPPPAQEGGQAGINDITWRAGKPQKKAGQETF